MLINTVPSVEVRLWPLCLLSLAAASETSVGEVASVTHGKGDCQYSCDSSNRAAKKTGAVLPIFKEESRQGP